MYKDRRQQIKEMLFEKSFVSFEELKSQFPGVSEMTLRRDINYLQEQGDAVKVRGGAKSIHTLALQKDETYLCRMSENITPKNHIARAAAQLLEAERSIFIDSGSTARRIVPFVPNERFTFTTTNPQTALELCSIGQPIVNLVGGRLDRDYQTVSGMQAMKFMEDINIDIALLCPSGFSAESGFTGGNYNECELKRAVVKKARTVIMLLDSSKFDRSLPYTFCRLSDIDCLICDSPLPEELERAAKNEKIKIIIAK